VEDSKNAIVFSTERIICSLSDLLTNFEHIAGGFAELSGFIDNSPSSISETEISRGLFNIAQGLQYLHTVQRKLHMNVTPECVVITSSGQWKLCGFGLSLSFAQGEQMRIASPYFMQVRVRTVHVYACCILDGWMDGT
jgi:SCY1-like protein 2